MLGFHRPQSPDEQLSAFKAQLRELFERDEGVEKAFLIVPPPTQQPARTTVGLVRPIMRGQERLKGEVRRIYEAVYPENAPGPLEIVYVPYDQVSRVTDVAAPFFVRQELF